MSQKGQENYTDCDSRPHNGSDSGAHVEGDDKTPTKTTEQMNKILCQMTNKMSELSRAYAKKYFHSEDLEADIREMYERNKDISLQEVNGIIYSNLKRQIPELDEFKKNVTEITLDLTGKQPESNEHKFFTGYFKDDLNFIFRHEDSEYTEFVLEKIVKQESNHSANY